jgi:hypothetical protein
MDRKKGRRWSSPAKQSGEVAALELNGGEVSVMNGGDGVAGEFQ